MKKSPLSKRTAPFTKALTRFLRCPDVSPQAKVVFLILKSYADKDGQSCFPSVKAVEVASGLCRNSVFKYLRELQEHRLITPIQRKNTTNIFLLNDDKWCELDAKNALVRRTKSCTHRRTKSCTQPRSIYQAEDPSPNIIRLSEVAPKYGIQ